MTLFTVETDEVIDSFRGPYRWLSNFHEVPILFEGVMYPSTEAAYMSAKTTDPEVKEKIRSFATAREVKAFSKTMKVRPDWDRNMRLAVMETVLRTKFTTNEELKMKLIETWPAKLVEGNNWGDTFWGVCNGVGENNLGKILMKIRAEVMP